MVTLVLIVDGGYNGGGDDGGINIFTSCSRDSEISVLALEVIAVLVLLGYFCRL